MRRSFAPNRLFTNNKKRSTLEVLSLVNKCDEPVNNENFHQDIVGKITEFERDSTKQEKPVENEVLMEFFSVVWSKPTTKKHKTWEGDGTLKLNGNSITLLDTNGKVISSSKYSHKLPLQSGERLRVGTKEVEIVDKCDKPIYHGESSSVQPEPETKPETKCMKTRVTKACNVIPLPQAKRRRTQLLVTSNENPFVFPPPTDDHQWRYNKQKVQVRDVILDNFLKCSLRPHQKEGLIFLYECVMGYRSIDYCGAILADEMGLGKTLQCVALIWVLLHQNPYLSVGSIKKALVIVPSSLLHNWEREFIQWLGRERIHLYVVDKARKTSEFKRHPRIPVMIISYEMFIRNLESIKSINFELIVCDEGHRLKNSNIKAAQGLQELSCKRRVLLTGTPVQNDLHEYFTLLDLVNPGILGSYTEFRNEYELPILASQNPHSTAESKSIGQEKASLLNSLTSKFVLRRTQEVVDKYLPSKLEFLLCCGITAIQKKIYAWFIDEWYTNSERSSPLQLIMLLKKVCTHPRLVADNAIVSSDKRIQAYLKEVMSCPTTEVSEKINTIKSILESVHTSEKMVLVSYSTQVLDLLAQLCDEMHLQHLRLDGNTPVAQRQSIVNTFNDSSQSRNSVFLLSARAGGVGLNLTGASRLILVDGDWNPSNDLQAAARIWRDGQKKNVVIYRLMVAGSIEEKIYQRQMSKTGLSDAIDDPDNIITNMKFSEDQLKDLFSPEFDCDSLTHRLLQCSCLEDGKENINKAQSSINYLGEKSSKTCSSINQLNVWDHFAAPFEEKLMKQIGINKDSRITFVFRKEQNISTSEKNNDISLNK